jgi:hypothetical protein
MTKTQPTSSGKGPAEGQPQSPTQLRQASSKILGRDTAFSTLPKALHQVPGTVRQKEKENRLGRKESNLVSGEDLTVYVKNAKQSTKRYRNHLQLRQAGGTHLRPHKCCIF